MAPFLFASAATHRKPHAACSYHFLNEVQKVV